MGAAAVAVIIRKEREIADIFRNAGATSPERARSPEELGVAQHLVFHRLVRRAVLREAAPGAYYLDELSWTAMRGMRRRVAAVMLTAVAVAGGVVALLSGL